MAVAPFLHAGGARRRLGGRIAHQVRSAASRAARSGPLYFSASLASIFSSSALWIVWKAR